MLGSLAFIVALYTYSYQPLLAGKGFLRKRPSHVVFGKGFIRLNGKAKYFLGGDTNNILLGDYSKQNRLLTVNLKSMDTTPSPISGADTIQLFQGFYMKMKDSAIYLFDGIKPMVVMADRNDGRLNKFFKVPYFQGAWPLSNNDFVLRYTREDRSSALLKMTNGAISETTYPLEISGDPEFSTDGTFCTTPNGSKLFYTYYYRNGIDVFDSSLKLVSKAKTIDTINYAKLKVATIQRGNYTERTITSPPLIVNKRTDANDKWLFVQSGMRADNETENESKSAAVIDLYSIKDGTYNFSIYIGDFAGTKMRDFRVYGNTLVALFDKYLYFYQLNF